MASPVYVVGVTHGGTGLKAVGLEGQSLVSTGIAAKPLEWRQTMRSYSTPVTLGNITGSGHSTSGATMTLSNATGSNPIVPKYINFQFQIGTSTDLGALLLSAADTTTAAIIFDVNMIFGITQQTTIPYPRTASARYVGVDITAAPVTTLAAAANTQKLMPPAWAFSTSPSGNVTLAYLPLSTIRVPLNSVRQPGATSINLYLSVVNTTTAAFDFSMLLSSSNSTPVLNCLVDFYPGDNVG